jgi:hypothetical protein
VCTFKNESAARAAQGRRRNAVFRGRAGEAWRWRMVLAAMVAGALPFAAGCVTVRPEQRAILADPVMQFQGDPREAAQRQHVLENREGSFGGTSVQGGGCGCN